MNDSKQMGVTLVTFASSLFFDKAQTLEQIALRAGWKCRIYTESDLAHISPGFFNRWEVSQTRGFGYWSWKPVIIEDALLSIGANDVLMYIDAGDLFLPNIVDIYAHELASSPYLFFQGAGKLSEYCKKEALDFHKELKRRDFNSPMIEAGVLFWRNSEKSRLLLSKWRLLSENNKLIDDTKIVSQLPEFIDHRHDQSLLSILCALNRIPLIRSEARRSFQCNVGPI
jgi:hypothetical protein